MKFVYIPYLNSEPATIDINGHELMFVGTERDDVEMSLDILGADSIECVQIAEDVEDEEEAVLESLIETIQEDVGNLKGGVVFKPTGVDVSLVISELKQELPWVH